MSQLDLKDPKDPDSGPYFPNAPLMDKRVRQAMYQAIDIEAIKSKVMRNFSAPAGLVTSPGVHGYSKDLDKRLKYDVAAAIHELIAPASLMPSSRICPFLSSL